MNAPPPLEEVIPRLRGVLHAYAFWVAGVAAVAADRPLAQRRGARRVAIYGAGLCALFAASGLYHRWRWSPRWKPLLRRLDHSTIYLFIAASSRRSRCSCSTARMQIVVLVSVWVGARSASRSRSRGSTRRGRSSRARTWPSDGRRVAVPQLLSEVGVAAFVLFLVGGMLYSAGATIYAARRPDPWPKIFGFHELFHALVIAAALVHFIAMAAWVVPHAAG